MADSATPLRDHVTLKVRSIDQIFPQAYVPKLGSVGQVCRFLRWPKANPLPVLLLVESRGRKPTATNAASADGFLSGRT